MLGRPLKLPSSFYKEPFKEMYLSTKNCREKKALFSSILGSKRRHPHRNC